LSEVGDVEEMAKNAVYILSDLQILERFRKQALEEAKRFDLPVVLPLYENLYKQVLRESKQIL
jgi:glycosyltransferase involved in cell wall biosynthesis